LHNYYIASNIILLGIVFFTLTPSRADFSVCWRVLERKREMFGILIHFDDNTWSAVFIVVYGYQTQSSLELHTRQIYMPCSLFITRHKPVIYTFLSKLTNHPPANIIILS
jgi:hypothetical protein